MKKRLLNKKKYPPSCSHCRHGRLAPDGGSVLCVKKGIVETDGKCRSYAYDPLKRIPRRAPVLPQYSQEDFSLEDL